MIHQRALLESFQSLYRLRQARETSRSPLSGGSRSGRGLQEGKVSLPKAQSQTSLATLLFQAQGHELPGQSQKRLEKNIKSSFAFWSVSLTSMARPSPSVLVSLSTKRMQIGQST